jgi:hypothetical protein
MFAFLRITAKPEANLYLVLLVRLWSSRKNANNRNAAFNKQCLLMEIKQ